MADLGSNDIEGKVLAFWIENFAGNRISNQISNLKASDILLFLLRP